MSKPFPALMAQWQERLPISMTLELIGMRKIDGKLTVVVQVVNHNKPIPDSLPHTYMGHPVKVYGTGNETIHTLIGHDNETIHTLIGRP
jgi:hypothetical protein